MRPPVGCGSLAMSDVHVIVTGPLARRPSIRTPLAALMLTTGIVMGGVPATVGEMKPGTLLYRTTPAAPAVCALNAFS